MRRSGARLFPDVPPRRKGRRSVAGLQDPRPLDLAEAGRKAERDRPLRDRRRAEGPRARVLVLRDPAPVKTQIGACRPDPG